MWQVDAETRAMLDRMKAPKKIDASAAAEPPVERKGSAWNSGGTWEEKDVSEWAKGALKARLGAVSATSPNLASPSSESDEMSWLSWLRMRVNWLMRYGRERRSVRGVRIEGSWLMSHERL